MKCPLMLKTWRSDENHIKFEPMNCLKEECAWWFRDGQRCCILDLPLTLNEVVEVLVDIRAKMPHAQQFVK